MMHGLEKSDPSIVAAKPTNKAGKPAAEPVEPREGAKGNTHQQRTRRAQDRESVSQVLARVRKAARSRKTERFTSLLHHLDPAMLRAAFFALRRDAAVGVDGLTWRDYEVDLDRRIDDLHRRVQRGAYRAQPARRRFIPKPDGRQRPLAIAALEDKIVQRATVAVLNGIYEEDFLGFSYGFRPGRGQHDALDALCVGISGTKVNHILDADIRSFFDDVSQEWLCRFLQHRIADPRMLRLIQKWLKAGILNDGKVEVSDRGTPQGAVISPLLANVYLHYAFDMWADRWRRQEATGNVVIVRYADDIVVGFEHETDAVRFREALAARLASFCLTLHPEKTRLIQFGHRAAAARARRGLGKPETFAFLGFHLRVRQVTAGQVPAPAVDAPRPHGGEAQDREGGTEATEAPADPCPGCVARPGGERLLQLSRGADKRSCTQRVPRQGGGTLEAFAPAAQPAGLHHLGADEEARQRLAAETTYPASVAK